MKRWIWILVAVAVVLGGLWAYGRAPTPYVLEGEVRRFHEDRVRRFRELQLLIAKEEAKLPMGLPTASQLDALKHKRAKLRREVRRVTLRGWEVVLIPAGAPRPEPEDFLRLGEVTVDAADDPPELRGPVEVWCAPRGSLAKLLHRVGAGSPASLGNG